MQNAHSWEITEKLSWKFPPLQFERRLQSLLIVVSYFLVSIWTEMSPNAEGPDQIKYFHQYVVMYGWLLWLCTNVGKVLSWHVGYHLYPFAGYAVFLCWCVNACRVCGVSFWQLNAGYPAEGPAVCKWVCWCYQQPYACTVCELSLCTGIHPLAMAFMLKMYNFLCRKQVENSI